MDKISFAATAPTHVSKVGIKARDADALAKYYEDVVGLREISRKGQSVILGAGETPLLEIEQASAVRADDPQSAGLYHTAFLLPARPISPAGPGGQLTSARRSSALPTIWSARRSI